MQSLRHLLPSAGSLIVFEAAARLESFTAAGRELGMSQAAVSYAIRGLEDRLGLPLFERRHRQVRLTEAGSHFFADVSLGLSHIRKSAEDLRLVASGGHVTLSASTAFASFWMMPRLQLFREQVPGVDLRIQTAERDLDIVTEGIPLGIRGGDPKEWPRYEALPLAKEVIFPVASPAYATRFGTPETVAELHGDRFRRAENGRRAARASPDPSGRALSRGRELDRLVPLGRLHRPGGEPQPFDQRLRAGHPGGDGGPGHCTGMAASGRAAA